MIRFEQVKERSPDKDEPAVYKVARMEKEDFTAVAESMRDVVDYFAIISHMIPHPQMAAQLLKRLEHWAELVGNVGTCERLIVNGYGKTNTTV